MGADGSQHGREFGDLVGATGSAARVVAAVVIDPRPADGPTGIAQAGAVGGDDLDVGVGQERVLSPMPNLATEMPPYQQRKA